MFHDEEDLGIFNEHEHVRAMRRLNQSQQADGLVLGRLCEACDVEVTVMIPWEELKCVAHGALPQQVHPDFAKSPWGYNKQQGKVYPVIQCGNCGKLVLFAMTPREAATKLKTAFDNNAMSEKSMQRCGALAQMFARKGSTKP